MTGRPHLETSLSTPDGKSRYVRRLFATIADRYDLITVLLSYGRDAAWKRRLVALAGVEPGTRALDLACGAGRLLLPLLRTLWVWTSRRGWWSWREKKGVRYHFFRRLRQKKWYLTPFSLSATCSRCRFPIVRSTS